jgi:predicted double-glycine peptidase
VSVRPSRSAASLGPLLNIAQTLNNCGPASVAEVLAYWHVYRTQEQTAAVLRGDHNPYGMAPYGVPSYARSLGLRAVVGVAGTARLVKALISNGLPVIVSQLVSDSFPVRHYRPIEAYDDRSGVFVASDPYLGQGHAITYADFARLWSVSNGRFVLIFPLSRQPLLQAVLRSAGWSASRAYRQDIAWERARARHPAEGIEGSGRYYSAYLGIAWDAVELGWYGTARAELQQALRHGANPITVGWIKQEMQRRPASS